MPISVIFTKRLIDIVFSLIILCVFLPVGIIIALLIKLDSPGAVFYKQRRVTRCASQAFIDNCTPDEYDTFVLYKFRTMVEGAEQVSGAVNASVNDPRVTRVGKFLRHTRLDEIPNFINVLIGDMSVVGPRADRLEILREVENDFPIIHERTKFIKPGITGSAQINLRSDGTIGCINSLTKVLPNSDRDVPVKSFRYKMYYDFAYTLNLSSFWSFLKTDLTIMLQTPYVMFFKRNVI